MQSALDVKKAQSTSGPGLGSASSSSSSSSSVRSCGGLSVESVVSALPDVGTNAVVVAAAAASVVTGVGVATPAQFHDASSLPSLQSASRKTPLARLSQRKKAGMHSSWLSHIHMLLLGQRAGALVVTATVVATVAGLHVSSDSSLESLQSASTNPSHFHSSGMH